MVADLEIGVRIGIAAAESEASQLLHHTMAAFSQLLLDFPTCGGLATDLQPVDEDYSPFEVADEDWRCGVDLIFLATGVEVGSRLSGPPPGSVPRDDPYEGAWPDTETVEGTFLDVDPLDIVDPED